MSTLGISQFPFRASIRHEAPPAPPAKQSDTFLSALIASAEKQSREKARLELVKTQAAQAAAEKPVDVSAALKEIHPPALSTTISRANPSPSSPLLRAWSWINRKYALSATKQLRVAETVSLGDKRFVAVVHVAGQKFLIGGGAQGVSLLTQLDAATDAQPSSPPDAGDKA
jgi:hypothetical protein